MSKLKDINLKDLGIKDTKEKDIFLNLTGSRPKMELAEANYEKRKMNYSQFLGTHEAKINNSNMSSKFLNWVNFIENIKNKPGNYLDRRAEWEKELEPTEFSPPPKPTEKTIPLTFRKFFYHLFPENITDFALKNPEKLPNLLANIRNDIQKNAQSWLDFVVDKQISALLRQSENYSQKGKAYKKPDQFQNIAEVIQWIIDTNLKTYYESADWNKDGEKTFSKEKGNLLIIDTSLYRSIEIAEEQENNQDSEKRKFPLPLRQVWSQFASIIVFPLKNNFQFIILDKRALMGWKDFQKLEIKYDEANSTTYFCRKMEEGFKQLTNYNTVAFIGG